MRLAAFLMCTALCFAGTRPRASSFDYRTQEKAGDVTVAAEILPPQQVKNLFSTDLSKYIVIEVAVYPNDGTTADVHTGDFMLRLGSGEAIRAANPAAIARTRQQASVPKRGSASDINIYPSAGIGYESGPYHRGVYTETGVGVGVGGPQGPNYPPAPASTDQDRRTMQGELEDKGLTEGASSRAVAGYLYFPASSKKNVTYDLEYNGATGRARLMLK
jgi:hypothetical protein